MRITIILLFCIGMLLGSFGSVLLYRLDKDCSRATIKGILWGRSLNIFTQQTLSWRELIPVVSRIAHVWKHKKPLPSLYIQTELGTGLISIATWYLLWGNSIIDINFGDASMLLFRLITNWLLWLLLLRDHHTLYLHMPIWSMLLIRVVGYGISTILYTQDRQLARVSLQSFARIMGIFGILYRGSKYYARYRYGMEEGIGQGDIYLMIPLALLLPWIMQYHTITFSGFTLVYIIVLFLTLSSLLSITYYLSRVLYQTMVFTKKTESSHVLPFFPGLIVARRIVLAFLPQLLSW